MTTTTWAQCNETESLTLNQVTQTTNSKLSDEGDKTWNDDSTEKADNSILSEMVWTVINETEQMDYEVRPESKGKGALTVVGDIFSTSWTDYHLAWLLSPTK